MSPYKSISQRAGGRRGGRSFRSGIPVLPLLVGVVIGVVAGFFVGYIVRLQTGKPPESARIVKATPVPTMSRQQVKAEMKDFVRDKLEEVGPGGGSFDSLLKLDQAPEALPTMRLEDIGRKP